jgi:TonB family protein
MKIRGRTIRTLEGLLISLLLHLLILLLFLSNFKTLKFAPPPPKSKKISLNLKQISTPTLTPPVPKPVKPPIKKPQPPVIQPKPNIKPLTPPVKKIIEKKPVKKTTPPAKKKLLDEKTRLTVEKKSSKENNITKITKKEKPLKKHIERKKRKVTKKPSRPKKGLAGALMGSGNSVSLAPSSSSSSYSSQMIDQLYGSEFDSFTPTQKKFIKKNLGRIHRITQRTLIQNGYPDIAVRTRQEGTNIVTFDLHPNGNITNLRLKSRIGYTALDKNTLQVIRIAYKEYPHPKTKTKITFYVRYSIY